MCDRAEQSPPVMSLNWDVTDSKCSRDDQARYAGRVIYNNLHPGMEHAADTEPSSSPKNEPVCPGDTKFEMSGVGQGKMSSVRRTFCLFVLFDLILMFILWVIYTQLIGDTGYTAFEKQVKNYDFKTSLFDAVMLSGVRFTLLLLMYGVLKIRHWWMVAICTAMTCGVLIAKIFLFDFEGTKSSNNPLSYCLIIISFVLAWAETWFLDFKVLPHERKLRDSLVNSLGRAYSSTLPRAGNRLARADDAQSITTEENNQFYSPVDTPEEGSDAEQEIVSVDSSQTLTRQASHTSSLSDTELEVNDYVRLGRHSWEVLWSYAHSNEADWRLESGTDETEGVVHSNKMKGVGKVFRLQAVIDMPPKDLFEVMTFKPEEQPLWNSAVKTSRVLQVVDDHTDILYNIAAEIAGGVITSRDFVSLRTWGCQDGIYMGSGMGVIHPAMPPQKNYVRGTNGVGGWVYRPFPGDNTRTLFFWFMNTDIKGWFPQKLIDANMAKVLLDFCKELQAHVKKITGSQ